MIITIVIAVIVVVLIILANNRLVKLKNQVKNSASGVQVYLQQRFDLIPNLVEVVKGYVKHEKETLAKIAELRTASRTDLKAGNKLNRTFTELYMVAESNPDLKAGAQFLSLQQELAKIENQLQAARRAYNMDVTQFNTAIESFPLSVFAAIMGMGQEELFAGDDEIRKNIKISF